jgi:cytidylate kinase
MAAKRWVKSPLETRISAHVQMWEKRKETSSPCAPEACPFITIACKTGCSGAELAYRLAEALNARCRPEVEWVAYDRELLDEVAGQMKLQREVLDSVDERRHNMMREIFDTLIHKRVEDAVLFRKLAEVARSLALRGHVVLVGRGCCLITQDLPKGLHIRLTAPFDWRTARYAEVHQISRRQAEENVGEADRQRKKFIRTFFAHDAIRKFPHHLVIDNSRFELDQMTRIVLGALEVCFGEARED